MATWTGSKQQAIPVRFAGHSLWRGCKWATNMSQWKGRTQFGSNIEHDSRTKNRGFISGFIGAQMSIPRWGGRAVNSNNGQTGIVWQDYVHTPIPQRGIYSWLDTGGMSLAVLFQFNQLPAGNTRCLTKRFGTANNFHGGAISFGAFLGNFMFSYCNGVLAQSVATTTPVQAGQTYLIVGRHWGNNGLNRAEVWLDGRMEGFNAAPATYPAYHSDPPIRYFDDTGSGDAISDGNALMGGLWDRPLTVAEIKALTVDPFVMWDSLRGPVGLGSSGGIMDGCKCGGPWLHAWIGLG